MSSFEPIFEFRPSSLILAKSLFLDNCHFFTRGLEHKSGLFKKDKKSPLHLHDVENHGGGTPGFEMKVTGVFGGDATKRQVRESVLIQQTLEADLINRSASHKIL